MPKQKIEIEVDVPEDGYEATGEYTNAADGDWYLDHMNRVRCWSGQKSQCRYIILRRVKQYREPVLPADWGKTCEFSYGGERWTRDRLIGYEKGSEADEEVWQAEAMYYRYCRIEKEPTE